MLNGAATSEPQNEVERRSLLDVVVVKTVAILELSPREDQSLLVRRDAFNILHSPFQSEDRFFGIQGDVKPLASQSLYTDRYDAEARTGSPARSPISSQPEHQMQRGFPLDPVIRQGPSILQLSAGKDQPLLVGRYALSILNFHFDLLDRIAWFAVDCHCFSCERFHKYRHAPAT